MADFVFTVNDNKLEEFKAGILKVSPNPGGVSDNQHIKNFIQSIVYGLYRQGHRS